MSASTKTALCWLDRLVGSPSPLPARGGGELKPQTTHGEPRRGRMYGVRVGLGDGAGLGLSRWVEIVPSGLAPPRAGNSKSSISTKGQRRNGVASASFVNYMLLPSHTEPHDLAGDWTDEEMYAAEAPAQG